jgi:hypothetical protein
MSESLWLIVRGGESAMEGTKTELFSDAEDLAILTYNREIREAIYKMSIDVEIWSTLL